MATIFTRIIEGEIPARMVWEDEHCIAFLDVRPLNPGHCLVVPRLETDQWTDLDAPLAAHLMTVGHALGQAQKVVFNPARIGLMIAGFEVPHVHLHVFPVNTMGEFDFGNANANPDQDQLDEHLALLRAELRAAGHPTVSER